jgi:hypothetical protein
MDYTRIAYNTMGYEVPSGPEGKSKSAGIFEHDSGFAWDEWLFNKSFTLDDGYQYGFIRGFNNAIVGTYRDIYLINYNSANRQFMRIAIIPELKKLSQGELKKVKDIYNRKRLFQVMKSSLNKDQYKIFNGLISKPENYCNIKFKYDDLRILPKKLNNSYANYYSYKYKIDTKKHSELILP